MMSNYTLHQKPIQRQLKGHVVMNYQSVVIWDQSVHL